MKSEKSRTRTAATAPRETEHLTTEQQRALEKGGEAEHQTGPRKERLLQQASKAGRR